MERHNPVEREPNPMLCSFRAAERILAIRYSNPAHTATTTRRRELGKIWGDVVKIRHSPSKVWGGQNNNDIEDFAPATGDGK